MSKCPRIYVLLLLRWQFMKTSTNSGNSYLGSSLLMIFLSKVKALSSVRSYKPWGTDSYSYFRDSLMFSTYKEMFSSFFSSSGGWDSFTFSCNYYTVILGAFNIWFPNFSIFGLDSLGICIDFVSCLRGASSRMESKILVREFFHC